jgi:hypothetical protein
MKISLSLLSIGMIATAATAERSYDFIDYTGTGLQQVASRSAKSEAVTTLYSTDFNSYTLGNMATGNLTSGLIGQDNWNLYNSVNFTTFTIVSTAGNNVEGGSNATNKLRSQWGTNTASGTTSYMWQDNGGAGFGLNTRMDGTVTEIDFDLLRSANSNSSNKGQTQLRTWDASGTFTTMGFIFDNYATGTQPSIRGLTYLGGPGVTTGGTYAFTLTTGSSALSAGVFHHYYTAFDATMNRVMWGWDLGLTSEANYYFDVTGYIGGTVSPDIDEFDFLTVRNSATVAGSMLIDNVYVIPSPASFALLGLVGIASRQRRKA